MPTHMRTRLATSRMPICLKRDCLPCRHHGSGNGISLMISSPTHIFDETQ